MAYNKTTWENGKTKLNETNLNKIEQGIYDANALSNENKNDIEVVEAALRNTELSYDPDTNFINIKIAADEKKENEFKNQGVNITMKASNISFDNTMLTPDINTVEKAIDATINGISLETKYKDLKPNVTYKVSYQGRYTVTGVKTLNYGAPFLQIFLEQYEDIYLYLGQYNLTEENTLQEILDASNSEPVNKKYISETETKERLRSKISFLEFDNTFIPKELDPESENAFIINHKFEDGQRLIGIAHIVKTSAAKYICLVKFFGTYNGKLYNLQTQAGNALLELEDYVSYDEIIEAISKKLTPENSVGDYSNLENGTGTNAIQMKQDGDSGVFDFTGKNPKATEIDSTLTGEIAYGATGNFATVVGGKASAQGKRSMAQGTTTIAKGDYSHAEGNNSVALGVASHAEGTATTANGYSSHAEGHETQALDSAAHAEGYGTIASGTQSHAEGNGSIASGTGSHATGNHTQASGQYSSTAGSETVAAYSDQFVVGRFNNNKDNTLFEVGNGEPTYRTNAFEVFDDGHAEVLVQGMQDRAVATKAYVDYELVNAQTEIYEKLEGKKTTFVLSTTMTISTIKLWIKGSSLSKVVDASGNDITKEIENGAYDNFTYCNSLFDTNNNQVGDYDFTYEYIICVKATSKNTPTATSPYTETWVIDKVINIFDIGDVVLIAQTNVPDRWYAGGNTGFYALESRKVDFPNRVNELSVGTIGELKLDVTGDGEFANIRTNAFLTLSDGNSNIIGMNDEGINIYSENTTKISSQYATEIYCEDLNIAYFSDVINFDSMYNSSLYLDDAGVTIAVTNRSENGGLNTTLEMCDGVHFTLGKPDEDYDNNSGKIHFHFDTKEDETLNLEIGCHPDTDQLTIASDGALNFKSTYTMLDTEYFYVSNPYGHNFYMSDDGMYFDLKNGAGFGVNEGLVSFYEFEGFSISVKNTDDNSDVGHLDIHCEPTIFYGDAVYLENYTSDIVVKGKTAYIVGTKDGVYIQHGSGMDASDTEIRVTDEGIALKSDCIQIGKENNRHILIEDDIYFAYPDFNIVLSEYIAPTSIPETWVDGATFTRNSVLNFIKTHSIIQYTDGETIFELKNCMGDVGGKLKGQDITIGDDGVVTIKTVEFNFTSYKLASGINGFKLSVISKTKTLENL